jgi:hypothetical protein
MTVADLQGHMKSGGMSPPFAGGPPMTGINRADSGAAPAIPSGHPPIANGQSNLPAGHPPLDGGTDAAPSHTNLPFSYKVPESWREVPAVAPRRASFGITDGAQVANVSVIDFQASAGPMMADPLANINRWRGEVGLPQVTEDDLAKVTEAIEVDGQPATLVDAVPDAAKPQESQADRGTVAVMLKSGDTIWFFKMSGNRDLVAAQRDQFRAFLKSVRFNASGGAHDGN